MQEFNEGDLFTETAEDREAKIQLELKKAELYPYDMGIKLGQRHIIDEVNGIPDDEKPSSTSSDDDDYTTLLRSAAAWKCEDPEH